MSPNWRFCLKVGALVALIDFAGLMLSRGQPPTAELRSTLDLLGLLANVALFSHVGFRTGKDTSRATAAAEAGVLASLLPALAAALYQAGVPGWLDPAYESVPLLNRMIAAVAFNIVLGGVTALLSGWLATISRARVR